MSHEIQCLYCTTKVNHKAGIQHSVDEMKKHVKKDHPNKPQI